MGNPGFDLVVVVVMGREILLPGGRSKSSNKSSISGGNLINKSGEANPQVEFRN